jgi:hypothetical protein
MKIGEIKVIHLILVIVTLIWIYLFIDWQVTKYQVSFTGWQKDIVGAVNNLDARLKTVEGVRQIPPPVPNPPSVPKKEGITK